MKKQIITGVIATCLITPLFAKEEKSYKVKNGLQKTSLTMLGSGVVTLAGTKFLNIKSEAVGFSMLLSGAALTGLGIVLLAADTTVKALSSSSSGVEYKKFKRKLRYSKATGIIPQDKNLQVFINSSNFNNANSEIDKVKKVDGIIGAVEVIANDIIYKSKANTDAINENLKSKRVQDKLAKILGEDANTQNMAFANQLLGISILGNL